MTCLSRSLTQNLNWLLQPKAGANNSASALHSLRAQTTADHSRRARRLANHLLLRLNPKREAATPIQCPPKAPAAPRLRFCAFGVKNRHNKERHYGFACRSYKQQLELDLRYT
jgi:hypothetical protein